jgi:hypothetical protein
MVQVGTSGNFHPGIMRSKIKQKANTLNIILSMFSNINRFIKLTQDCHLYFLNFVTPLPKNGKGYLVPRETLWVFVKWFKTKSPSDLERLFL